MFNIVFSDEISFFDKFLSNLLAANFLVIAEEEEYKITPLKVFNLYKLFFLRLMNRFLTNHIGAKLIKKEFS